MKKFWRGLLVLAMGLLLLGMMGTAGGQTTNAPGVVPVTGTGTGTNPPSVYAWGGTAPVAYTYPLLDTNGLIIWPPYFWETNGAPVFVVNATTHGAVGDGVANDTAPLLAAVAAGLTNGGSEVVLEPGVYKI